MLPSYCRKTVLSAAGAAIIACKLIWVPCQSGPSPPLLSGRVICEDGEILLGAPEERSLGSGVGELRGVKRRDRRPDQNKRRRSELWKQKSVKSIFKDGHNWVISEYDIASYFTHSHARAHTGHLSSGLDPAERPSLISTICPCVTAS